MLHLIFHFIIATDSAKGAAGYSMWCLLHSGLRYFSVCLTRQDLGNYPASLLLQDQSNCLQCPPPSSESFSTSSLHRHCLVPLHYYLSPTPLSSAVSIATGLQLDLYPLPLPFTASTFTTSLHRHYHLHFPSPIGISTILPHFSPSLLAIATNLRHCSPSLLPSTHTNLSHYPTHFPPLPLPSPTSLNPQFPLSPLASTATGHQHYLSPLPSTTLSHSH